MRAAVINALKYFGAPMLYRTMPIGLRPRRFQEWLNRLAETQNIEGAVLEVGCASGGTASFSRKFMREGRDDRPYICVDTFRGFVKEQYAEDVRLGNSWRHYDQFSGSSRRLVRRLLDMHGASDIELIQGDISKMSAADLPQKISCCLLDVDLAVPIYDGLRLVWPILQPGGVICVDDCYEENSGDWQALKGLKKFCDESGVPASYAYGIATLKKPLKR
jgi:hypothetical protein